MPQQQTSITVYCLPTKETKLQFSVSVCSKQTEVFLFHLQQTNESFPFSFSVCCKQTEFAVCLLQMESKLYIHIYMYMLSFYEKIDRKIRRPGNFLLSVYHLLILQTVICRLRNKRKLPVSKRTKRNKQTCPSMLKSNKLFKQPRQHLPHGHNSGINNRVLIVHEAFQLQKILTIA